MGNFFIEHHNKNNIDHFKGWLGMTNKIIAEIKKQVMNNLTLKLNEDDVNLLQELKVYLYTYKKSQRSVDQFFSNALTISKDIKVI